jgi:hypothetical protein
MELLETAFMAVLLSLAACVFFVAADETISIVVTFVPSISG